MPPLATLHVRKPCRTAALLEQHGCAIAKDLAGALEENLDSYTADGKCILGAGASGTSRLGAVEAPAARVG